MIPTPRTLALSLAFSAAILPGAASAYSLAEAVQKALESEPGFLAAQKALEAGREARPQAIAAIRPQLSAELGLSRRNLSSSGTSTNPAIPGGSVGFSSEFDNLNSRTVAVSLNQPLFNQAAFVALDQSSRRVAASELELAQARQTILLNVAQRYFDVLASQDTLTTLQAEKRAIAEQLESAKRNFEVGNSTVTDQQEAQARFDLVVARELQAQNALDIARDALTQLTGIQPPAVFKGLSGPVAIPRPTPADPSSWAEQARTGSLDVALAKTREEIARLEVDRRQGSRLPTLGLGLSYADNRETSSPNSRQDSAIVGLSLNIPLYTGGLVSSQVREAIALQSQAGYSLDATQRASEQAARSAYLNLVSGLSQISALEAAERSSRLALESNRLGYDVGVRINIDVLNAQQQLFAAQRDLSRSRYDALLASLRLKAAAGQLALADVNDLNQVMAASQAQAASEGPKDSKAPAAGAPPKAVSAPAKPKAPQKARAKAQK